VQKGGARAVKRVLAYGEPRRAARWTGAREAPGNDGVSSTAMTVAGAHVCCSRRARDPDGISRADDQDLQQLRHRRAKAAWIDFDAGALASGVGWDR
jgi:altronate hydrolase